MKLPKILSRAKEQKGILKNNLFIVLITAIFLPLLAIPLFSGAFFMLALAPIMPMQNQEEDESDVPILPEERIRTAKLPFRLPIRLTYLLDGFKWACREKNTSVVILIDGKSGRGKTTLGCQAGVYCDPNFSLAQVYFTPESFLEGLSRAQPGSFHLFDESMIISNRSALSQVNKAVIQAMSMIRSKKIIVAFCVNSLFDLDKNLALHRSEMLIHVYSESLTARGKLMCFFQGADGNDKLKDLYLYGKKMYSYNFPKSNFNATFSGFFPFDEKQYEDVKQKNVNEFLNDCLKGNNNLRSTFARDKYILYLLANTDLTQEQIADIGGLSRRTVAEIVSRYRQA